MAMVVGGEYRVYIEDKDGKVISIKATAINITSELDVYGVIQTNISLISHNQISWHSSKEWDKDILEKATSDEWKCDYCGRPNNYKKEICTSCGASRSFIYQKYQHLREQ